MNLRSLITDGFESKLILLRGYMNMERGIEEFNLPWMTIDKLFMPEKLGSHPLNSPASRSSPIKTGDATQSPKFPPGLPQDPTHVRSPRLRQEQSYSSALQRDHGGNAAGGTHIDVSLKQSSPRKATSTKSPIPGLVECNTNH